MANLRDERTIAEAIELRLQRLQVEIDAMKQTMETLRHFRDLMPEEILGRKMTYLEQISHD